MELVRVAGGDVSVETLEIGGPQPALAIDEAGIRHLAYGGVAYATGESGEWQEEPVRSAWSMGRWIRPVVDIAVGANAPPTIAMVDDNGVVVVERDAGVWQQVLRRTIGQTEGDPEGSWGAVVAWSLADAAALYGTGAETVPRLGYPTGVRLARVSDAHRVDTNCDGRP